MSELITLQEISEKYKVKKATINARLKKIEKEFENKTLSIKGKNNTIFLTDTGLELLEKSLKDNPVKTKKERKVKKHGNNKSDSNTSELIKLYQEQIKRLESDLNASRKEKDRLNRQIDKLMDLNAELTGVLSGALKDSQQLLNQEQSLALIDKTTAEKRPREKKSLLSRLAVAGRVLKGEFG